MEEILASIRRIIAEDGGDQASPGAAAGQQRDRMDVSRDAHMAEPASDDDDVLELTEVVDTPDADGAAMSEQRPETSPDSGGLDDFEIEQEEVVEEVLVIDDEDPLDAREPRQPDFGDDARSDARSELEERLVSAGTAAAAAAAFAGLGGSRLSGETIVGGNTLDAIVRELLRPLLKQWLDTHLPAIVDDAVRDEIARIAREARPD